MIEHFHGGRKFYCTMYLPTEGGRKCRVGRRRRAEARQPDGEAEMGRLQKALFATLKSANFTLWTVGHKGETVKKSVLISGLKHRFIGWNQSMMNFLPI